MSIRTAVAWAIFHQLLSRSDEKLVSFMTHPGDGQYACLTAAQMQGERLHNVLSINLNGTGILVEKKILRYKEHMTLQQINKLTTEIAQEAGFTLHKNTLPHPAMEVVLDFLKTNRDFDIFNAWRDDPYSSGLCEEIQSFPFYPVSALQGWRDHISWWIILKNKAPLAICNLETDQLILENGECFNLTAERRSAVEAVKRAALKLEFISVINETKVLLVDNPEWQTRYLSYANKIQANKDYVETVRGTFREWSPLLLYLNVSNAKKARQHLIFELRYLGQTVAQIRYKKALLLDTTRYDRLNLRDFGCDLLAHSVPWNSPEAAAFRSFFKARKVQRNSVGKSNEEHRLESLLLTEFSKPTCKQLPFIQPIKVAKLRFPMPTPLHASHHNQVTYSGPRGGGIDIFARVGKGKGTVLAILELKDENTVKEPPKDAVKQAITYAVFIRELLRSDAGAAWWQLFGFGGSIPEKLKLVAACVMPTGAYDDESFASMKLAIDEDIIQLHYIYFTEQQNVIVDIQTSLELEKHYGKGNSQ